jgi:hypothetical protein
MINPELVDFRPSIQRARFILQCSTQESAGFGLVLPEVLGPDLCKCSAEPGLVNG